MEEFIEKLIGRLEEREILLAPHAFELSMAGGCTIIDEMAFGSYRELGVVKEIVNELAEEHKGGWIPCSERLPDDFMSFEYLTIRKGHTLATITYYCVANKKWYLSRNSTKEIDVIAWQPLPEHYKQKTK